MKKIYTKTFGIYLNGREEGQAAFFVLHKELEKLGEQEKIFFDFSDVIVLAPSWCDEFFSEAEIKFPQKIIIDENIHDGLKKSFLVVAESRNITFQFGTYQ